MKMKKYNAPSIAEAMKLVRADLGDDAVILNSKVVTTKKFFGIVKKKSFEVVAGVDHIEKRPVANEQQYPMFNTNYQTQQNTQPPVQTTISVQEDTMLSDELKKEIADLKSIMQSLQRQTTTANYPEEIQTQRNFMVEQELDEELITEICDELFAHAKTTNESVSLETSRKIIQMTLTKKLSSLPLGGISFDKKFVNILGPTGVGKTTTIAKIAARAVLEQKKKIGFITTDTYRIAAIEQLKTYAGLLQAPVEVVYNADDYKQAIAKLQHVDLIFIDTAGRNYKEAKYIDDLQKLINFDEEAQSYLVLSSTAKEKDLKQIIEQFSNIPIEKFIFTKLDEANSVGMIFNLMIKYKKGLAYYTTGQEVPEDIEQPSLEKLFDLFFQGEYK